MSFKNRWAQVVGVLTAIAALLSLGGVIKGGCSDVYASASRVESLERRTITVERAVDRIESKIDTAIELLKGGSHGRLNE